jgi:drug/metabolite transporter (DMT)-like permease
MMKQYKVWLMLTLCVLFWAGNYVFGKFVVAELSPIWMTFSRWFFASFLLFPIAQVLEKPNWREAIKMWPTLLALALLGYVGYNSILYTALRYTSSTNAALVNSLNPALIIVLSTIVFKEKLTWVRRGGIVISLVGVMTILTKGQLFSVFHMTYNRGDLIMLLAIVVWSLYSLVAKQLRGIKPITATAFASLFTVIILSPFALREGFQIQHLSTMGRIGMAYIVLFPSVGSFIFWNISVIKVGASRAGIFMNLMPVFTAIISVAMGARLYASQIIGGAIVLIGVALTTGVFEKK